MSFYSSIAKVYDEIFPFNPAQLEFVERCFNGSVAGRRIIDAGCGTGSLAIMLARRSARVTGFDADEKMIRLAEEKRPQALDLRFKTGDLVGELYGFEKNRYDAVLCFGNTLVHLKDKVQIDQFVKNASSVLKPGGKLLIQIVNYDRGIENRIKDLPAIETRDHLFERNYSFMKDGHVSFKTILTNKKSGEKQINEVLLLPLRKNELEDILKKHFAVVECYGDFKMNAWSPGTFHLVIKAER